MQNHLQAIIFDMDDTLVATARLWRAAEDALLQTLGSQWSAELASQYKGMNALDVAATIHHQLQPHLPLEQCQRLMRDTLIAEFKRTPVQPMPGAIQCVKRMKTVAPLALASGSPLPAIHIALGQLGLERDFQVILSSESVKRGKPQPDVFLAAADTLHAEPRNCLVFEDSLIGVRAAKTAGMSCFAVPSSNPHEIASLATRIFNSLDQVTEVEVKSLSKIMPMHG